MIGACASCCYPSVVLVDAVARSLSLEPRPRKLFILRETLYCFILVIDQGLCKLLLSFCQRMTSNLHYSFGDKDNKELPHIAFPLVASVDSLVSYEWTFCFFFTGRTGRMKLPFHDLGTWQMLMPHFCPTVLHTSATLKH